MTKVYMKVKGELLVAEFDSKLSHEDVTGIFKGENFKPDDNRFMLVHS